MIDVTSEVEIPRVVIGIRLEIHPAGGRQIRSTIGDDAVL
jgi:hypothetical protein